MPTLTAEIRPNLDVAEGFLVCRAGAYPLPAELVVDTTGAGDAHIAGLCAGILHRWPLRHILAFAARVAWCKLQREGARDGLPRRAEVAAFFPADRGAGAVAGRA